MVYISGSNNGTSGYGMYRALFPGNMGNVFGQKGYPLPNAFANSAPTVSNPRNYGKRNSTRKNKKSRKTKRCKKSKSYRKH